MAEPIWQPLIRYIQSLTEPAVYTNDFKKSSIAAAPASPTTPTPTPTAALQRALDTTAGYGRNPDIAKYNISPDVHQAIQRATKEFNVLPTLMYDIAASEGGFRPDSKNETPEGQAVGVPVGLYQFTPGTWNGDLSNYAKMSGSSLTDWNNPDRADPYANARAAAYLIAHGQLGRWTASKPNWGRFYSKEELKPYYSQTPGYQD